MSPGPLAFPIPRSAPQPFARLYGAVRNAGRSTRTTGGEPRGREPGDDYWVIVSLPSASYTNGGYPSLPGSGTHPTTFRKGAYPVTAVKGKETRLDLRLEGY